MEASRTRKRLLDSFTQYDIAARRIRDLPTDSPTQKKLQKAIHQEAVNFLHLHMLPLKSLPKVLKQASSRGPNGHHSSSSHRLGALASIKYNDVDTASQTSSSNSAVSLLEAEERHLRERLIVLEEQKFLVGEMLAGASARRHFDEVTVLSANLRDLDVEIDQTNALLGQLDFAAAYERIAAHAGAPDR